MKLSTHEKICNVLSQFQYKDRYTRVELEIIIRKYTFLWRSDQISDFIKLLIAKQLIHERYGLYFITPEGEKYLREYCHS